MQEFSFNKLFNPLTTRKAIWTIIIIGFIVFGNMLFNGFVWDDKAYVIPNISSFGLNIPALFGPNYFNGLGYYRPIPAIYFSIINSFFGIQPFHYHFIQLLIHIFNTALLYILFKTLINRYISLLCCLIFLVHPMQVESVSYIAQATSVLYFAFGLSALLISVRTQVTKRWLVLTGLLLLLCLLTKESGIIFALLILTYRYLFHKGRMFLYSTVCLLAVAAY